MFRLIRTFILLVVAFTAGFLYSELTWQTRCEELGGTTRGGVCFGSAQ